MKFFTSLLLGIFLFVSPFCLFSQKVGIGSVQFVPASTLDVKGNMTIGAGYASVNAGPANGVIVQGCVGIGITSPALQLHVAADGYNFRISNAANSFGYNIGRNTGDGFLYFYGDQGGFNGYVFTGVNREFMRILNNGNVGIGTATPA